MTSIRDLTALDFDLRQSTPLVIPDVDERAARRSLLGQIAKLERELSALFCSTYPRTGFEWQVRSHGGPRLLGLADLERIRDDLAERLHENRAMLSDRTYVEAKNRRLVEEMMLAPEKHKWMRIGAEDIGERGCKYWEVRPRLGLVGMLMGWWRVKISSGCPLPGRLEAARRMGKRSRKTRPEAGATTRAERDARRQAAAAAAPTRRGTRETPPAPWGSFPLTELVVLLALIFGVIGFIRFNHQTGKVMVAAAMCLGSLGGLEVSIREHFAGFKSHTTLLAASCAVGSMILVSVIAGKVGVAFLALVVGVGVLVFVLSFYGFRQAFIRRSGGLSFR